MERLFWIFDLDGTLTVPVHDFEGIRKELGLPVGKPILEEIDKLPQSEAMRVLEQLDAIEFELARSAVPQTGAGEVVRALRTSGCQVGIFTRNSKSSVQETLKQCGLQTLFQEADIITRESCKPKPSPEGIHVLLSRWKASPNEAVMVGDYLYDMIAGRDAGVTTVGFDGDGHFHWTEYADYCVPTLPAILDLPIVPS
jgi:HAD superfamily hydrolase (TIGR01509 family)